MKIFSPLLATVEDVPVEMVHLGEDSKAERSHRKTGGVVSGDLRKWGSFEESVGRWGLRVWKESLGCFQGNFKKLGAGFLLIAAFAWQTITLPWYLSDLIPYEKPTIPFFQHLLPRQQSGERARVAVGPRGPLGPRHPFWGRTAHGKVPADLQPFLALPAWCLPRGHPVLAVELPQCPASSWLRLCWIFTFFP